MGKQIELPQMGESVDTGTVLSVLVKEGDQIEEAQGLIEVETDKATTEIPSPEAGVIEKVLVKAGDEVKAGQPIVVLAADGEAATGGDEAGEAEADEGVAEGEEGEAAEASAEDQEPRRAGSRRRAAPAAEPKGQARPERAKAEKAKAAAKPERDAKPKPKQRDGEAEPEAAEAAAHSRAFASPTVRRLARELGVELAEVPASAGDGQVSEGDVKAHVRELLRRMRDAGLGHDPALPDFEQWGEIERQPMSAIRRKTAEVVRHSWRQIPHVTQFHRADITDLDSFREKFGEQVEQAGGRLTLTAILIKVAAEALSRFPRFNASVDVARAEVILKRSIHVGVAMDTKDGLLVPVLRSADRKSLTEVAIELAQLAERARAGDVAPDDLQGATFSVTNLGALGTAEFTPIVPWPQVAILAVGRAHAVAAVAGGELVERRILPLGVSYDHRCVDGADAARFLGWMAEVLEEPMRMTMEPMRAR